MLKSGQNPQPESLRRGGQGQDLRRADACRDRSRGRGRRRLCRAGPLPEEPALCRARGGARACRHRPRQARHGRGAGRSRRCPDRCGRRAGPPRSPPAAWQRDAGAGRRDQGARGPAGDEGHRRRRSGRRRQGERLCGLRRLHPVRCQGRLPARRFPAATASPSTGARSQSVESALRLVRRAHPRHRRRGHQADRRLSGRCLLGRRASARREGRSAWSDASFRRRSRPRRKHGPKPHERAHRTESAEHLSRRARTSAAISGSMAAASSPRR